MNVLVIFWGGIFLRVTSWWVEGMGCCCCCWILISEDIMEGGVFLVWFGLWIE